MFQIFLVLLVASIVTNNPVSGLIRSEDWHADIYDFIVVGAGSAGSTIASRLSENGRHSVLLLERGGEPPEELNVPALSNAYLTNSSAVLVYNTVPQKNAGLQNDGIIQYITGNIAGGGSSIGGMIFNRGSPYDYDNWATTSADDSFKYQNLLRLFHKMETYDGLFPSNQHGFSGPIHITRPRYAPAMNDTLEAGQFLGFPVADASGPQSLSFTPVEFSQYFGRRVSSYNAYLQPILGRPNLKLITNAYVSKILFDKQQAVGVVYTTQAGESIGIPVRKEIIISAGVINSPVLLMKSGIGPRDQLEPADVDVVKELPVGLNLHDHVIVPLRFIVRNTLEVFNPETDLTPENLEIFNEFGEGPYTIMDAINVQAFAASTKADDSRRRSLGWADIQLKFMQSAGSASYPGLPGLTKNDLSDGEVAVTGIVSLVRPKSRGRITLNTTDLNSDPLVDFQYLSDGRDMDVILEGIKFLLKVYEETPSYQRHGARYPNAVLPACNHLSFRSDDYWKCYARQVSSSGFHGAGTCRFGSSIQDPRTVVDSTFRVVGVENLRVADASVMPEVVNADTQAAVYVIAEKVSEDILRRWEARSVREFRNVPFPRRKDLWFYKVARKVARFLKL